MIVYQSKAQEMARGGSVVRMANGGSAAERAKLQRTINDTGANEYERSRARNRLNALNTPTSTMEQFPIAELNRPQTWSNFL